MLSKVTKIPKKEYPLKISSPDDIKRFAENEFVDHDTVEVAVFLDTKNQIINTKIIPEKLILNDKAKFITEHAILNDSNSYILVKKENDTFLNDISTERFDEVKELKDISNLVGIKLLDTIDFSYRKYTSFKEKGYLREGENHNYSNVNLNRDQNKNEIKKISLNNLETTIEENRRKNTNTTNRSREINPKIDR